MRGTKTVTKLMASNYFAEIRAGTQTSSRQVTLTYFLAPGTSWRGSVSQRPADDAAYGTTD